MTSLIGVMVIFCLLISFLAIVWFVFLSIDEYKINLWLKKNRSEKWEELSSIGSSGPGFINPKRAYNYIYSNEDDDKIEISKLKSSYRKKSRILKYLIIALIFFFVVLFLAIFILK